MAPRMRRNWMQRQVRLAVGVVLLFSFLGCSALLGIGSLPGVNESASGDATAEMSSNGDEAFDAAARDATRLGDAQSEVLDADADAAPALDCVDAGVDTVNNPNHCGGCGHDCLGATCEAGICASKTLAVGEAVGAIVANDTTIFWAGGGALRRIAMTGGVAQSVASPGLNNGGLAIDSTNLYYSNRSNGRVETVGLSGGPISVIGSGGYATGVALDSQYVYWGNGSRPPDGNLLRAAKSMPDGGAGEQLSGEVFPAYPVRLAVSAGYLYWLSIDDPGDVPSHHIRRVPVGAGLQSLQDIASAPGLRGFGVDAQYVYYATPLNHIARVKTDGSDVTVFIDNTDPVDVQVTADEIFWSTTDTKVMKARKSDGLGRVTLYAHPTTAGTPSFTVGAQYVVLSPTGSEVVRVPR